MSRPIPEGIKPPEGCVILGWGKEFTVPDRPFDGWMRRRSNGQWLVSIGMRGVNPDYIYAAPADSEVARLNAKPGWFAEAMGEIMQDPKDALIREMVERLEHIRVNASAIMDPENPIRSERIAGFILGDAEQALSRAKEGGY